MDLEDRENRVSARVLEKDIGMANAEEEERNDIDDDDRRLAQVCWTAGLDQNIQKMHFRAYKKLRVDSP
ncbi:hypothetical protein V5O48_010780 [Marasmius crinis-equi]|uniref:Uncharacterized protein n=1 Tax=Marasmius crinis-equi TaxID=585013 RepID=A0ABR3F7E6_9AGAR